MPVLNMHDTLQITRIAAATMSPYARVKIDSNGQLALAGATELGVGFLTERGATSGQPATYRSIVAPEVGAIASQAILVGAPVYTDASGKVTDVSGVGQYTLGIAVTAAAGDGSLITIARTETTVN